LVALDPACGVAWAGVGAFLIGVGMGFCNTTFIVSTQTAVAWEQRGIATSLALFTRMVGQSLGASAFGAVLNIGVAARLGEVGDAIDRLMEPGLRHTLGADEIHRLVAAIGAA